MEPFRYHVYACDQRKPEGAPSCTASGSLAVIDRNMSPAWMRSPIDSEEEGGRDRVEITLTSGRVRVTNEDGKTQEVEEQIGVVFSKANLARHDVQNVGETVIRAFHVELK